MCSNTAIKTRTSDKSSPDPKRRSACQSCVRRTAVMLNTATSQNICLAHRYTDYTTVHTNCYGNVHLLFKKNRQREEMRSRSMPEWKGRNSRCQESSVDMISPFHWHGASGGAGNQLRPAPLASPIFYKLKLYIISCRTLLKSMLGK